MAHVQSNDYLLSGSGRLQHRIKAPYMLVEGYTQQTFDRYNVFVGHATPRRCGYTSGVGGVHFI